MKRIKTLLKKLFFLPAWLTLLISIPSFSLLVYVFVLKIDYGILAYAAYFASAYSLSICICFVSSGFRLVKDKLNSNRLVIKISEHPISLRLKEDILFRERFFLHFGSAVNLIFAVIKLTFGLIYSSIWFIFVASYYLLLAFMRLYIIRHIKKSNGKSDIVEEYKISRICAVVLLLLNQVLTVIVALMVYRSEGYEYPGYLIYIMAGYCFYMVISTAVNLSKFRKIGSPLINCIKVISFTVSLVSVLSLETAMIAQFGDGDTEFRQAMVGGTSVFVCTTVLICAVYIIVKATKKLKNDD